MPPEHPTAMELAILPLTFLQIVQSAPFLTQALVDPGGGAQSWFGTSAPLKQFVRLIVVSLYYHIFVSSYGAFVNENPIGWLSLRGRDRLLYIDTLMAHPAWRRQGVGSALLHFAERQALELNREWVGLMAISDPAVLKFLEKNQYHAGHARILAGESDSLLRARNEKARVGLKPAWGLSGLEAYRRMTRLDIEAGDPEIADGRMSLLGVEPYRLPGREWIIEIEGQPAAYLRRHGPSASPVFDLAGLPRWWGSPELISAVASRLSEQRSCAVEIRLASRGHHEAMRAALSQAGFQEQPDRVLHLFKNVAHASQKAGAI